MAKYAIYITGSGTAAARPVQGVFEVSDLPADTFAERLADQAALVGAGEAVIQITEASALTDLDDDVTTYDYTVNTTLTPPVALTPVSAARYTLAQRQAAYRRKRDELILKALSWGILGRDVSDTVINAWLTYAADLRDLEDEPANPEGVAFPTEPAVGTSGTGRAWDRILRRGNVIGTVGKLLGVPIGALIEHDNTSTGYYEKLTSGLLICTMRAAATYSSAATLNCFWTFPHEFGPTYRGRRAIHATFSARDNSNTTPTGQLTPARMAQCEIYTNTQGVDTGVQVSVRDGATSFVSGDLCWLELTAIGRWD